jgi:hypothetical protein
MAIQVPRYETQVQERAAPNVQAQSNAPIEAFGGGTSNAAVFQAAQGLAKSADSIIENTEAAKNKLAMDELAKANQTRMLEERRALNEWEYGNIYDPENGAINRRGKDALSISRDLSSSYDKFLQEREKGLANEEQRLSFRQMAEARRDHVNRWALDHTASQAKALESAEFKAGLESSKERASVDPRNVGLETAFIRQQVQIQGEREGWGAEQMKQALQAEESDLYGRVVNGMLAKGNDMGAKSFFEKIKPRMDPDMASKLEADLLEGSTRGESQRIVDKLVNDYSDLGAAREAVREIKDPKLRDAVDDRLKMEFGLRANEDNARRDKNFMDAYSIVEQSKKADNIPPALYNQLTPSQRTSIRALEKQVNQVGPQKQDDKVYLEYLGMPIQQIAKVSEAQLIERVRPNVSEASFKEIARRWETAREGINKGNKSKEQEFKSLFSDDEIVFNSLKKAGVAGLAQTDTIGKLDDTKATAVAEFRDRYNTRLQAYFHETGKNANDEVKQKIMRDMVIDRVFVQQKAFGILDAFKKDTEASGRDLSPEDRRKAYVPIDKIPPASAEAIRRQLQSRGKAVTTDKIQRAYAAAVSGDTELVEEILGR